jgi:hypothetical protein
MEPHQYYSDQYHDGHIFNYYYFLGYCKLRNIFICKDNQSDFQFYRHNI